MKLQEAVKAHEQWYWNDGGGACLTTRILEETDEFKSGEPLDLGGVFLRGADLRNAVLRGARLEESILIGANLREANFDRAILKDADLSLAQVDGIKLNMANTENAILPDIIHLP